LTSTKTLTVIGKGLSVLGYHFLLTSRGVAGSSSPRNDARGWGRCFVDPGTKNIEPEYGLKKQSEARCRSRVTASDLNTGTHGWWLTNHDKLCAT